MGDGDQGTALLKLKDFSAGYRHRQVFDAVSVELPCGTVALLGPNGAGKSTLMATMAGVSRRFDGGMAVMGMEVTPGRHHAGIAKHVGYLPQKPDYDRWMTVAQHVAYCGWLKGMSGQGLADACDEALAAVSMGGHAGELMGRLSGGMLRRAAIAGTLVSSPRLLVLDEPTVGLDPAQRVGLKKVLSAVSASTNILLATHLVEDVVDLCDVTAIVVDGRFVRVGSTAQIATAREGKTAVQVLEESYLDCVGEVL